MLLIGLLCAAANWAHNPENVEEAAGLPKRDWPALLLLIAIVVVGFILEGMGGKMAGKWAARAALTGDLTLLDRYEAEWNEFYGDALERGFSRRQLLERHPGKLEDIIRRCWIGFREYYGEA